MNKRQAGLAATGLSQSLRAAFSGREAAANVAEISKIHNPVQQLVVRQAFAQSMQGAWILDACLVGVGFLASAFVVKAKLSEEHVETKTGLHQPENTDSTQQ
jgi:hypothetical protein